jgi:hypothetical protein
MPSSVKNERDERLWDEAKKVVRDSYADVEEGSDRFWKLVQGIYQRMKGERPNAGTSGGRG